MKLAPAKSSVRSAEKLPDELPLTQHAFEFAIYGCLSYGDEAKIAEHAGKGSSYYSQMFNPDDPRESILFRAAQDIVNWINHVNKGGGKRALAIFNGYIEAATAEICENDCTVSELHKENTDSIQAAIDNAPIHIQTKELIESIGTSARRLRKITAQKEATHAHNGRQIPETKDEMKNISVKASSRNGGRKNA